MRDKITASKKKGMWMGGFPPLGYDVKDRKLVANEAEAETVRCIFRRYQEPRPAGRGGWQMSDGTTVHYIHLLEQIQAVQKGDIVYDAGGVQGETERLLKRRGATIKR